MSAEWAEDRAVLRIGGGDAKRFLQDLVTNDLKAAGEGLVYAALLSPQGKYLFDFFLARQGDGYVLDVKADRAQALAQRLAMYRLRADVTIEATELKVNRGLGEPPAGAFPDPRHPALGWRSYDAERAGDPAIDWTAIRVEHCVPETGVELIPDDSYILEAGFEPLHGVDFRKGCYVGQEVTARMKHKTELRKGLRTVLVQGEAPVGTEVTTEDGKPAGTLYSQAGGKGIAYLRLDRAKGPLRAGAAVVTLPE